MKNPLLSLLLSLCLLSASCSGERINGVKTRANARQACLENDRVRLCFDLRTGLYSASGLSEKGEALYDAYATLNDFSTLEADSRTAEFLPVSDSLGRGATLRITSRRSGQPELVFDFTLYPGQPFVLMHAGLRNTTDSVVHVHRFSPLAGGRIFRGHDLRQSFRALDGEGGGATTAMHRRPQLGSQNNLIIHFGDDAHHHSLVAGGVSYHEFAKYARIGTPPARREQLTQDPPFGLKTLGYYDLGADSTALATAGPRILPQTGQRDYFESSSAYPEAKSVLWNPDTLTLQISGLTPGTDYALGLGWCDDSRSRWQSVWLETAQGRRCLLASTRLPSLNKDYPPVMTYFELPGTEHPNGEARIVVRCERGMNAVLSEALLLEGKLPAGEAGIPQAITTPEPDFDQTRIDLYAKDAVGKRVDPGNFYRADGDGFYLDFATPNPMEAAETYASALRTVQQIRLNYYYFPTICMWYAMEPKYGGSIILGTNDSPGAVAEMQRVNQSGWLRYTTMAIRLVPDCYADNNQNGWWDDLHWQMHGSGAQDPGMKLKSGHYRAPYETTRKWAQAVIQLGGKPFMYSQTAVRSEDYALAFPGHMLFNESFHTIPQRDVHNKTYASYDFTDPAFREHMRQVYRNMDEGGIQGMMFDYPYTGWPFFGGMEDPYATAAGAYRAIFQLAHDGPPGAYLHERNIKYGSDITLGLVSSQRTWGDTDVLVPEMVSLSGLRWYKNRRVVNYDMDGKNLLKAQPDDNPDGLNKLLTMSYTAASRLLLANSFGVLNPEQIHRLSRIFPYHQTPQSARPLDAFTADYPRVYGFRVNDRWQELTFYNEDDRAPKTVGIELSGVVGRGGAGMDPAKRYYAYDFWNDTLRGVFSGSDRLEMELRRGEARQIALREVESHPQVLSTDRHLMQGYLELSDIRWDAARGELSGIAEMIGGEPMTLTLALNGATGAQASADTPGTADIRTTGDGLAKLRLTAPENGPLRWKVSFAAK